LEESKKIELEKQIVSLLNQVNKSLIKAVELIEFLVGEKDERK